MVNRFDFFADDWSGYDVYNHVDSVSFSGSG